MFTIQEALRTVPVASPSDTVEEVSRRMNRVGAAWVLVCTHRRPVGLVTAGQIAYQLLCGLERGKDHSRLRVGAIMRRRIKIVSEEADSVEVLDRMAEPGMRELIVVNARGEALGLLSVRGILEGMASPSRCAARLRRTLARRA